MTRTPGNPGSAPDTVRVVVLRAPEGPRVEVLALEAEAAPGAAFRHLGTTWRITGERPRSRVLIADPEESAESGPVAPRR